MIEDEDAFVFADLEECYEKSNCYRPDGFCPVRLGEIFGSDMPRYRIAAKLGWSSYATVWLARDLVDNKTVALKILEAAESQESREAAVLERLRAPAAEALVLQLLDSFTVTSPNGVHQAQTTGTGEDDTGSHASCLDLHTENIGVALPELGAFSEIKIWEKIIPPDVLPLVAYDPAQDLASFPPYLCEALDLGKFLIKRAPNFPTRGPPEVRIMDLGSAYAVDTSPSPRCNTPLLYRPPEVVFPQVLDHKSDDQYWDRRSDIWSLACMFELASGRYLFGDHVLGTSLDDSLLRTMARASGGAPDAWMQQLSMKYTSKEADEFWNEGGWVSDQKVEDAPGLVQLLRRMIVIEPAQRPTAEELLRDSYFDGLQVPVSVCSIGPSHGTTRPSII
ncbi:kinase-like domain-containing protein [Mycena capillaripes]|nr:kinase-like domain-containing protein [Mycena capillaripes]